MFKNLNKLNKELSKPQKRKSTRKLGNQNIDLKKLLKSKTLKKIDKDELVSVLEAGGYNAFLREIKKYFEGNSKVIDDKSTLVEIITNKKLSKALFELLYENDNIESQSNKILFYAISELWLSKTKAFINNEKIIKRYLKLYSKFESKKIKAVKKLLDVEKKKALQICLVAVHYKGAKLKSLRSRFSQLLQEIYGISGITPKKVNKLINICFKDCDKMFISFALAERKKNDPAFEIVTTAILNRIEDMDKEERKELIKNFAKRKIKNPNMSSRTSLLNLDKEKYKGIVKTVNKLTYNGLNKTLFE